MSKESTITRENDFPAWYLKILEDAELFDYAPVKGCIVFRPHGYAIWERIQALLGQKIKETGHQNCYFPLLIPESFITKEKNHIEGFSPELAVVTHAGGKKLEEPYIVRPTSETIIWHMFKKWIQSYRDLPLKINQWANIVRWEMRTRPFLRTTEFLWQEGHTAHATFQEAEDEALLMLNVYKQFLEDVMAIPVITGKKSESQKFPGAHVTYTLEILCQDGKALQGGTSHNLGQNFSKVFDVTYLSAQGSQDYPFATSWGVSTRLIGAMVMVHGDDRGIIIPPALSEKPVAVVPIWHSENRSTVMEFVTQKVCPNINVPYILDDRDHVKPGAKFHQSEKQGIPVRIEVGAKEVERNEVVIANRLTYQKTSVPITDLSKTISETLAQIQKGLYAKAQSYVTQHTHECTTYEDLSKILNSSGGFIKTCWCGNPACEVKFQTTDKATIRCTFDVPKPKPCIVCGNPGKLGVYVAKAY